MPCIPSRKSRLPEELWKKQSIVEGSGFDYNSVPPASKPHDRTRRNVYRLQRKPSYRRGEGAFLPPVPDKALIPGVPRVHNEGPTVYLVLRTSLRVISFHPDPFAYQASIFEEGSWFTFRPHDRCPEGPLRTSGARNQSNRRPLRGSRSILPAVVRSSGRRQQGDG